MSNFIQTPIFSNFLYCVLFFGLLAIGAYWLTYAQKRFSDPEHSTKSWMKVFGLAALFAGLLGGGIVGGVSAANSHNLDFVKQSVMDKYGYGISAEINEEKAFDIIRDSGKDVWQVEIVNTRNEPFEVELRFDTKSGEPILTRPNTPGLPPL